METGYEHPEKMILTLASAAHITAMNHKSVFVISERENFDYYRAIPLWEQQVEFHPIDCPTHLIQQGNPDLLLIDCGFDECRGLSLLHEIKATRPEIMVILVTDAGSEETAVKAFRLGARDYFRKPVDLFELKVTIEKLQKIRRIGLEKRAPSLPPEAGKPDDSSERIFPAGNDIPTNLLRLISFIEKNLSEPLTIDRLADEAGVSRFHFCRVFKKAVGMSPISFLTFMRIERTKALLRKSIPVSTVALKAGFNDLSNFNRQFKRQTGLSPTAYRDSLKP
jgi:AraC family transcriptional regulator